MDTTTRKAFNPDTEDEKDVEIPAASVVKQALLDFDYPAAGIQIKDIADELADQFELTDEQRNAKHRGGYFVWRQHVNVLANQLVKSEKLLKIKRGWIAKVDPSGLESPASDPVADPASDKDSLSLEVVIESNYRKIQERLEAELLQQIKDNSPEFFEQLVLDVLVALGYGGSRADAETVGRSGDGGIDGIIKEDRLGLDNVYVQAKRWDANISPNLVREFAGALDGKGARKGIFITTAGFSKQAKQFVEETTQKKIVLIDGNRLVQLMIDRNIGVYTQETYDIKQVDLDYFAADDDD